jgi:hypothetical protein
MGSFKDKYFGLLVNTNETSSPIVISIEKNGRDDSIRKNVHINSTVNACPTHTKNGRLQAGRGKAIASNTKDKTSEIAKDSATRIKIY